VKTVAEALLWVKRHRVVLLAAKVDGVPSLAHELIGGPFKGSWWGHEKGKLIFELASALEDSDEVLLCKLVEGKATFVHASVWPALARVVLDESWRRPRIAKLDAAAKKLFERVEREGQVRGADAKAVKALEACQLALVVSEHTDKGHHQKVLTAWSRWAQKVKPMKGSLEEALDRLKTA
jgi:hypothetical protein